MHINIYIYIHTDASISYIHTIIRETNKLFANDPVVNIKLYEKRRERGREKRVRIIPAYSAAVSYRYQILSRVCVCEMMNDAWTDEQKTRKKTKKKNEKEEKEKKKKKIRSQRESI